MRKKDFRTDFIFMNGRTDMISSMTGFGRGEAEYEGRRYAAEIKSVNHRFLDVNIKMPKSLSKFEGMVRGVLKEYLERGKVDVYITFYNTSPDTSCIHYNKGIASEYLKYLREISTDFGLDDDIRVSTLSRFPDVFTTAEEEFDEDQIWKELEPVLRSALKEIKASREREGEDLKRDLLTKLDAIKEQVLLIEEKAPEILDNYRKKITEKVEELLSGASVDESRILTEVTIFADKICVDEEMTRLKSHITAMGDELKKGGAVGRKLDFIAQEMNREANTTLSKANDLFISDTAIEIKTGIEKIREQVQNIE